MRKMRQKGREEREMEEKREKLIFFKNIICWYSLYYFNKLYVKIEIEMLSKL